MMEAISKDGEEGARGNGGRTVRAGGRGPTSKRAGGGEAPKGGRGQNWRGLREGRKGHCLAGWCGSVCVIRRSSESAPAGRQAD